MTTFAPKELPWPGYDTAVAEQLKQLGDTSRATGPGAQPPTSAFDFADKVQRDFLGNVIVPKGVDMATTPQPSAGATSGLLRAGTILSTGLANPAALPAVAGAAYDIVKQQQTYGAEDSAIATQQRQEDAKTTQSAMDAKAAVRARLRAMPDAEAQQLGLPIPPGGNRPEDVGQAAQRDLETQQAIKAKSTLSETTPLKETWFLNALETGARSFAQMGTAAAKWPVITLEGLNDAARVAIGRPDTVGQQTDLHVWLDSVDKSLTKMLPGDPGRAKDFVTQLASGTGSMLAFLLAGWVSGGTDIPAAISIGALGAATEGSQMYDDAALHSGTALQKYMSFILGSGLGVSEAVPIERMFLRAEAATGGMISTLLHNTAAGSLEEFIQETGQTLGEDIIAKYMAAYDATRHIDIQNALRQGLVGGITGAAVGGSVHVVQHLAGINDEELNQKPQQPQVGPDGKPLPPAPTPAQIHEDVNDEVFNEVIHELSTIPGLSAEIDALPGPAVETTTPVTDVGTATGRTDAGTAAPTVRLSTPAGAAQLKVNIAEDGLPQLSVVQDQPNVQYRGGTPPAPLRDDGRVQLVHWAQVARSELDPNQMGTGPYRGQERQRLAGSTGLGRTYFGINARADLPAKERRKIPFDQQRKMGYVREPGLGNARHEVSVDPNDLYNWYEDPLNLKAGLDRELAPSEQITQYEGLIKKAGFKGYWIDEGPQGQTAALFTKAVPDAIIDERTQQPIQPEPSADEAAMLAPEVADRLMEQVPGFAGVLPYLTDDEQQRVAKRASAQKLVDIFSGLPDAHEMAAVAVAGSAKRGWYARSAKALIDIFGLNDAPRFAALLAALSPQTSVEMNTVNAINMWTAWIKAGRPTERKAVERLMAKSIGMGSMNSVLDAWVNNTVRALTTKDASAIKLSGPKVSSFMLNLQGITNEVTNDTWMANFANIEQSIFRAQYVTDPATGEKIGIKSPGYIAMSVLVRKAAQAASQITGDEWTAAEVQETVWSWTKALVEMTNAGRSNRPDPNATMSFQEITQSLGLTDEQINATPDFAQLFVGGIYRQLLEKGGYGDAVEAVAASSQQPDGRLAGGGAGEGGKAVEVAKSDLAGHLTRAAARLDQLRARRLTQAEAVDEVPFYHDAQPAQENPALTDEDVSDFLASVAPDAADLSRLPGLPASSAGPVPSVVQAARAYAESRGLALRRQAAYVKADPARGARIAAAYEAMAHDPQNPAVKKAYEALIEETLAQYQFVKASGLQIEFIEPGQDPYPEGPKQVHDDLQRGHLWVFPTDQGFGTLTEIADNPLLVPVDESVGARQLVANDVFRIVHDFFGHGLEGVGFGATGEENAWQAHMRLFSPKAVPAMTSETRGQNSWVNFGPHGERNRANQRETIYADQKVGLMPSWTWTEGVEDDADFVAQKEAIAVEREVDGIRQEQMAENAMAMAERRQLSPAETRLNQLIADEYKYDPTSPENQARLEEIRQLEQTVLGERNQREASLGVGTSASRAPYKGERTRQPVADTGQQKQDTRLAQIAQNFIGLLNLTVRQGRLALKGSNVMGVYSRKQATVRLRSWNDLSTLVHEGGHALHDAASAMLSQFVANHEATLMKVADEYYGRGVLDTAKLNKDSHVREGFAEFFRLYVTNPAKLRRDYGPLHADFDQLLKTQAPDIYRGLQAVSVAYETYLNAPSAHVLADMIVPGIREEGMNAAMQELYSSGFKSWMSERARRMVQASLNRYAALNTTVAQLLNLGERNTGKVIDLKVAQDPRKLARLAPQANARAMIEVTDGVYDHMGTAPVTKGLRDAILRAHGIKDGRTPRAFDPQIMTDFSTYLVGLRVLDEYRRFAEGKLSRPPVSMTKEDVKQAVSDLYKKYGVDFVEAANMVNDYATALWDKTHKAGLMSDETHDKGLDRQFYVPLQRDMSDKQGDFAPNAVTGGRSIVKAFRGSNRNIVDPLAILMHKTFALEATIASNEVAKALAVLADKAGKAGALVERVPASAIKAMTMSVEDAARQLTKDDTLSEMEAHDLMTILSASIKDGNAIKLFRSEQVSTLGENIIFFWENGKIAALQLNDGEVGSDMMQLFNGLGHENMSLGIEALAATSSVARAAVTHWADFLLVNFVRDQMATWVLNDVGFKPFVSGIKGITEELRQKKWAQLANASMMTMGGVNVASLHDARVTRDINALRSKGYFVTVFNDHSPLGLVKGFAKLTELSETGTRLGLFQKAYERAKRDGLTDWEASLEAAYTATDTMDFGLNGSRMTLWRRTIPFFNAQLQGYYKMFRALGADEVRQRKGLAFVLGAYFKNINNLDLSRTEKAAVRTGRKMWMKMVGLGLISAAIWAMFRNDDDYQEASEYLRTTSWIIPLGDGRVLSIPKPFELALIANLTERGLEAAAGDPAAMGRFVRGFAMTSIPPLAPPGIQLAVEQMANYDFFADRTIVPDYMAGLIPELQYDRYTSELAKWAGRTFGWSPMVVDHWLQGLGASAFRDIATVTNSLNPNRPSLDAADEPVIRRFIHDVRRGAASARDFWAVASTRNGELQKAANSYKAYIEAGQGPAAERYLAGLDDNTKAYALLMTNYKAEAKRLNPFYRARQVTTVISTMRREIASDLSLENTDEFADQPTIRMSARQKKDIDTLLSELARREMRNVLAATGTPGWAGKQQFDTEKTVEMIGHLVPEAGAELERRMTKAKVYPSAFVNETWPEVRDRLLSDHEEAYLDDLVEEAKAQ